MTGRLCIILSAVFFGMMPLLTRTISAHGGNAYTSAFFRFAFGSLFLLIILKAKKTESIRISKRQTLSVAGLSTFYAMMLSLLYSSYVHISTGLATTLHFTYPAAVILLQLVLFRVRPSGREVLCLILAVDGILLMNMHSGSADTQGMALAVFSGVVYAFYIVLFGKSCVRGLPAMVLSFWISVFAAIILGLFITATANWKLPEDETGWVATVTLAILTNVLALVLFQRGLQSCGGVEASLLSTFEPMTGLFIGCLAFHESFGISSILAVGCILCSVCILLKRNGRKETHEV